MRTWMTLAAVGVAATLAVVVAGQSQSVAVTPTHTVGLVDVDQGLWRFYDDAGLQVNSFYFGNPGDYPIVGDWDCDTVETPGMYRQTDGYVYLRNSNTQGPGDVKFFFGNPGDVPLAGDFDGDGCDTVSIYRPSNQTFYIINELGANNGGLGAADISYVFGDPGDKPFVGDFDGDGKETMGLHRESTGLVYFRDSHGGSRGDREYIFGDPGDRLVAGDWTGAGFYTLALFRPSDTTMYFRFINFPGNADREWTAGQSGWVPVSGIFSATTPPASTSTTATTTTATTSSTSTTTTTTAPAVTCQTATDAVAYWCFDDETDPTDDGAAGNDATVVGAAFETVEIPPLAGNMAALRFDGTGDHTTAADPGGSGNLDGFTGLTLTAWVNPDVSQSSDGCCGAIVSKYDRSDAGVSWGLDLAGNHLRFVYPAGEWSTAGATVPSGVWSHVAGVWDGDSIHLYIDGDLVGTGPTPYATMPDTTTPVSIGSYEAFADGERSGFFDGLIDEVYVFDRGLAPAEVAVLAGAEAAVAWHVDLALQWVGDGGNTRYEIRWTPGLGFAPSSQPEVCTSSSGALPAPQDFPYEIIEVTYNPGSLVRFDFANPLRPVQAWLHDGSVCSTPDAQGGGLPADEWWFQFDSVVP